LKERLEYLRSNNKLVEARRSSAPVSTGDDPRTGLLQRHRKLLALSVGVRLAPPPVHDYLPADALLVIDESHVSVPQVGAMYKGDRSRKKPWWSTASVCRRRWTTGRCVLTSGSEPADHFVSATPGLRGRARRARD
jgi:hypothetical protein